MKLNRILLSLFIILNISCNNNKEYNSIKLNPYKHQSPQNEIKIQIDRIVPLESTDKSIIGKITKLKAYKDKFIVFDFLHNRTISCFAKNGKLEFKIPVGKGPGEVISVSDFSVYMDTLFIKDRNFIKKYDITSGNFIEQIKVSNFGFNKFVKVNHGNFLTFGFSPPLKQIQENTDIKNLKDMILLYKVYDKNCFSELNAFVQGNYKFRHFVPHQPFTRYNDHTLCLAPPTNDIIHYKNNTHYLKYRIDFGSYSFQESDLERGMDYCINLIKNRSRVGLIDNINETNDLLTFSFVKNIGEQTFAAYSKKKQETFLFESLFKKDQKHFGSLSILSSADNKLIGVLYPSSLDRSDLIRLKKDGNLPNDFNINSNPLIVIFNVKI